MPPKTKIRKIEAFAMHARTDAGPADYLGVFEAFKKLRSKFRIVQTPDKLVAVPRVTQGAVDSFFVVYEGPVGMSPLIFNAQNAQERIEQLDAAEVLVTKTHVLADPGRREVLVEFNARGARARDVALVIQEAVRTVDGWESLQLHFQPIAGSNFHDALGEFERVRIASLKLARPNYDWNEHYNGLSELAADSDAQTIDVSAYAERGGSLSKRRGLLRLLRDLLNNTTNAVVQAKVTGNRTGEPGETTISLENFIEHHRVQVAMTNDGHVETADMREQLFRYLEERRRTRGKQE